MPYCPECEYRYPAGVEVCPDCATPLVETLDADTLFVCDECKEPVTADAPYCSNCGTVFIDTLRCYLHPDTPAHGRCITCGQHVCKPCGQRQSRRFFCPHHSEEEQPPVQEKGEAPPTPDWEGVLYGRHLRQAGVVNRPFSHEHDPLRVYGVMDTTGIRLVAPFDTKRQVAGILKERDITGEVVVFECDRCSAISRINDRLCPNCGR